MPNIEFTRLLESSEGLTDGFKAEASTLFESAVNEAVESVIAEKLDECKKQCAEEAAKTLNEQVESKVAEQVEICKKQCADEAAAMINEQVEQQLQARIDEQMDSLYKQAAEHGAKVIREHIENAKTDLSKSLNEQYAAKYETLLSEAEAAKSELAEATTKYETTVRELSESVEKLAAEKAAKELEPICEKLTSYADYVAEQYVNSREQQIVSETKAYIGQCIIDRVKGLFEELGAEIPAGSEALEKQIADLTEERDQAYSDLAESIEARQQLENQLFESRKATALAVISEGMVESDRAKLVKLMEGVTGDLETFTSRAKILAESICSPAEKSEPKLTITEAAVVTDKAPTITEPVVAEKREVLTEQHKTSEDHEMDYIFASLQGLSAKR